MATESNFELRITQRAILKGDVEQVRKETYPTWKQADTAFELYNKLVAIDESGILFVEFIEHKHEVVHKRSAA